MELKSKQEVTPICPHCNQAINELWHREIRGFLGRRYIYFCPHCCKILGVSHRKGFFMG